MNIKKIKIFNNGSWVEYALDGTTIDNAASLEVGSKPGSTQTKDAIWNGGTRKDEENIIRVKDGDYVEGAIAEGFQSVAFGGKRYDKVRKNDEIDTSRKPTSAEGNQSFAAGASVHAIGDFSVALNKDTKAYHKSSMAIGGGTQAGRSKKEFEEYFYDAENQVAINNGLGLNDKNEVLDADGNTYEQAYSFAFAAGSNGKALGYSSTKLGGDNESIGVFSLTNGEKCYAYGNCQTILGYRNTGLKNASHLIISGQNNESDCIAGAVFGTYNRINGRANLAAGSDNIITTGTKNTILNSGNKITSGNNQYVGGHESISSFSGAFVHGHGLTSSAYYQAVLGKYNKDNSAALLIVGNGISPVDADRKNAFEVLADGIKTSGLQAISDTDQTIYFHNNLNGNRTSSIWANDINILLNGEDGSYTSVGNKFKKIEETLETKLNLDALDSDFFSSIY